MQIKSRRRLVEILAQADPSGKTGEPLREKPPSTAPAEAADTVAESTAAVAEKTEQKGKETETEQGANSTAEKEFEADKCANKADDRGGRSECGSNQNSGSDENKAPENETVVQDEDDAENLAAAKQDGSKKTPPKNNWSGGPVKDLTELSREELQEYANALAEENDKLYETVKRGQAAHDQLVILKRDFDNFRRRNQMISENAKEDGKVFVIEKILTILDTFDRAAHSLKGKAELNSFLMVYRQFESVLAGIGVEEIDVLNKEFDPNVANAVVKEEVRDEKQKNKVLEIYAKGYRYKEKIVRYAQVKVGV